MLLEEFVNDPRGGYIKAERYVNDGSPSGLSFSFTTSEHTRPRSLTPYFDLAEVRFTDDVLIEEFGRPSGRYAQEGGIFVHPDMLGFNSLLPENSYSTAGNVPVVPTASGRTVLVLGAGYFIKLAYIGYLGRLVRHINREMLLSACEVTRQLVRALDTKSTNPAFSILREDCGRLAHIPMQRLRESASSLPRNPRGCYEWGVLFREFEPYPYLTEDELLIPFFALFGPEYNPATGQPFPKQQLPLLMQLFEKQSKPMPDFLLEDLIFPLCRTYFDALLLAGVELEAHAQNMLLTIGRDYAVKRIVCRDLESAGRDVPLMEYLGLDYVPHGSYKCNRLTAAEPGQKYPKYYINHSFMFDFKLGVYLISPLIDLASRYSDFDRSHVVSRIKEFNRQFIQRLPTGFFPPDWCSYANVNWDLEGRTREYIWRENPPYR